MKKISAIGILFVFVASILAAGFSAGTVSAADVPVKDVVVKVDNELIRTSESYDRGDVLPVKVLFTPTEDDDNVEVSVFLKGSENQEISATSDVFKMVKDVPETLKFDLKLPEKTSTDKYTLKVMFNDRTRYSVFAYPITIDTDRHLLTVKEVTLSPAIEVQTGRLLVVRALVKNMGYNEQEDVKVTASISDLGVLDTYIIDSIKAGKSEETGNLQIRIPDCATVGKYDVKIKVQYNDEEDVAESKASINVVSGDTCSPLQSASVETAKNTIISVIADPQDLTAGVGSVVYPLTLTNTGKTSKAYTLSVEGADFADVKLSPANVLVVDAGKTAVAYLSVGAKSNAQAGQHLFVVNINTGDGVEQVTLKANVVGSSAASVGGLKKALEVILVVFIVILVIVVLVVLFNKLRSNDDSDSSGQTYY